MQYLVITRYEDEPGIDILSREELEKRLSDADYYGHGLQWVDKMPRGGIENWPSKTGIIFAVGKAIVPEVVTTAMRLP